jgi:Bacterial regulatory proteins, luxR family
MTNSTYTRLRKIVSTWKKSQASRPSAWARRNARQEVSTFRGAGLCRRARRIRRTVAALMRCLACRTPNVTSGRAPCWPGRSAAPTWKSPAWRSSVSRPSSARSPPPGGTAVIGYTTALEVHLLAGLAYRQLGEPRAANQAAEDALAIAEHDRVVPPFAMTGSAELLKALPRHETGCCGIFLSDLSRSDIANELSVSPNTVSSHIRSIYAKLSAADRSAAVRRARQLQLLALPGWPSLGCGRCR